MSLSPLLHAVQVVMEVGSHWEHVLAHPRHEAPELTGANPGLQAVQTASLAQVMQFLIVQG